MSRATIHATIRALAWAAGISVFTAATGAAQGAYPGDVELAVGASVAAAANNQTLAAATGKRTYISGFTVTGTGATAASTIAITVTGVGVTFTYHYVVPAGAGVAAPTLIVEFSRPIPASADNTAIVVAVPSFGAGNLAASASAHGFQR